MFYCQCCDYYPPQEEIGNGIHTICGEPIIDESADGIATAEKRGFDAAIAKVREWAAAQKARCVEKREVLRSENELESWLKWRGSEHTVDALLEFLMKVQI